MTEANLSIKVDSRDVKKAEKDLTSLSKTSAKTEKATDKLAKTTSKASKAFKGSSSAISSAVAAIDGPLGGISSRISALTSLASNGSLAVGLLAGSIVGLGAVTTVTIRHMAKLEVATAKTNAILKATGFAAGLNSDELDDMARSVALSTLASVEGVKDAQNALLTFKSISGGVFSKTIMLSQDLASVIGGTIKSSAIQLGKALEDPIKGLSSLSRVGVTFSESQREQIELFVETGEAAEAQSLILATLESQLGGTGVAAAQGFSGAMDTLGQRFDDFLERIDRASGSTSKMTSVINQWGIWLNDINQGFGEAETTASVFQRRLDKILESRKLQDALDAGQIGRGAEARKQWEDRIASLNKEVDQLGRRLGLETASTLEIARKAIASRELADQLAKVTAEKIKQEKIDKIALKTATKAAAEQKKFIRSFDRLQDKIDPVGAELRMLGKEIKIIQKAFSQGLITNAQADAMVNALNDVTIEFENAFSDAAERISDGIADALISGDWDSLGDAIGGVLGASVSAAISEEISANLGKSLTANSGALSQISAAFAGPLAGAIAGAGIQIAVNEALSFLSNDFGDDTTAADRQASQGTGTVLGDMLAKTSSIADATDITSEATSELVGINRDMLAALQIVQAGISGAVTRIAQGATSATFTAPGVVGGEGLSRDKILNVVDDALSFATLGITDAIGLKSSDIFKALDAVFLGAFSAVGKLIGGKSKKTDEGVKIIGGAISDLVDETLVQSYASFKTKKHRFSSTKRKTKFQDLDDSVNQQFELVFGSIVDSVVAGADALGLSSGKIQSKLDKFVVETQQISLKGLNPEEQAKAIQEVFGTVFDNLALSVIPFLDDFQRAGEGLGETLARVATNVQVTSEVVSRLGLTFDDLNGKSLVTASTRLVEFAGGVGEFVKSVSGFISNFATDEQKLEIVTSDLTKALEQQNLVIPDTRDGYWDLLKAQNASTEGGAANVAALLRLQDVADEYYGFLEDGAKAAEDAARAAEDAARAATEAAEELAAAAIAAAEAAHQAAMSVSDVALDAIRTAVNARKDEITDAYNIERDLISQKHSDEVDAIKGAASAQLESIKATRSAQLAVNKASISAARDSLSLINKEVGGISSALSRLTGETGSIQASNRQAALAQLRSGSLSGAGEAAGIAANISAQDFATAAGFERAQGTTRILLEDLEKSGMATASAAERTIERLEKQTDAINSQAERATAQSKILAELSIEAAEIRHERELAELDRMHDADLAELDLVLQNAIDQLNVLRNIDASVLSLGDALASFAAALSSEGSAQMDVPGFARGGNHSGGIRMVGENGPELEFTGPSRIMNTSDSKGLLSNTELAKELREMRNELRASQFAIAKNTGKSSKQLERWDVDGLPAERV